MINKLTEAAVLKFKNLSPEEKEKRGILGRLYGKVADFTNGTRNGRKYSESLWENLLNSDLIKERFANGGIFGQLCHPDYEEVDMEKVACVMPEPPVKDKDGQLVAYVDILDTPCGRIAYQLAKYGYKLGISSRGTGDLITGPNGEEEVDPETYQLNAFDLVEIPAVESARLSFVESLDKKRYNKTLRQALTESLNKETDDNKKIVEEALDNLGISLKEGAVEELAMHELKDRVVDEIVSIINDSGFDDNLAFEISHRIPQYNPDWCSEDTSDFVNERVETYKRSLAKGETDVLFWNAPRELTESSVQELDKYFNEWKEKNPDLDLDRIVDDYFRETGINLAKIMYSEEEFDNFIAWAKENGFEIKSLAESVDENGKAVSDKQEEEEVVDDKSDVELVAEFQEALLKIKKLEEDNLSLQEQLSVGNAKEIKLNEELRRYKGAIAELSDTVKQLKPLKEEVSKLNESLAEKDKVISTSNSRISSLVEARRKVQSEIDSINESKEELLKKNTSLTEELEKNTKELAVVSKQLDSTKELVEKYRHSYKSLKENYLEARAKSFGLRKEDVLKKLDESYKVRDIDKVCEELSQYKANMAKLPFRLNENTKVSVKQSKNEYIKDGALDLGDDSVSDSLLQLANIK